MLRSAIVACLFFTSLQARDLGIYEKVFSIKEKPLEEALEEKMATILEKAKQYITEKIKKGEYQPPSLNLATCEETRVHFFDPSVVLEQDLYDHKGNVLMEKGHKVNPLETNALDEALLFFDGDNAKHVQWAKEQKLQTQWILTSGSPFRLMKQENRAVYFDQLGVLTKKFGIRSLPAIVSQEGLQLKIEELALD